MIGSDLRAGCGTILCIIRVWCSPSSGVLNTSRDGHDPRNELLTSVAIVTNKFSISMSADPRARIGHDVWSTLTYRDDGQPIL